MTEAEREQGIQRLTEIGVLIPFDENLKLYHGRARDVKKEGDKEWEVDAFFDNSGNSTLDAGLVKTRNVNAIAALHVAKFELADKFAFVRVRDRYIDKGRFDFESTDLYKKETIRIVPFEKGKFFLNDKVKISEMSNEDKRILREVLGISLSVSAESSTNYVPLDVDADFNYNIVQYEFEKYKEHYFNMYKRSGMLDTKKFITNDEIADYSKKTGLNKQKCEEIAGIINATKLLYNDPLLALSCVVFGEKGERIEKMGINFPVSKEYILSWAKKNDIVGLNIDVTSVSVGEKISDYIIFDKDSVGSEKQYWLRENKKNMMSGLAKEINLMKTTNREVLNNLANDDPEKVVDFIVDSKFYVGGKLLKELYNADSRVTEEFTVAEHTETVLRIFEESFKDEFPESLHPFIRLVILAHDAGKSMTRFFHDPMQKAYNQGVAKEMLSQMGINEKVNELIQFIIGDSQIGASNYMVKRQPYGKIMLEKECKEKLTYLGLNADAKNVNALERICLVLQYCDGAAYTIYAKTRNRKDKDNEMIYRNCNKNFSRSFKVSDMGKIVPVVEHENI